MRPASEYDEPEAQRRNGLSLVVVVVVVVMVKGISLFCLPEPEALLMDCPQLSGEPEVLQVALLERAS